MALKLIIKQDIYDKQDNDYVYKEGDTYPREGLKATDKRIKEIKNKVDSEYIFSEMTVSELKNHLDEKGIEYSDKAKKDELLTLVGD